MNPTTKTVGIHVLTIGTALVLANVIPGHVLALVGSFAMGLWSVDLARWIDRA